MAALVAGLPEAAGFVLAGGGALAAHGLLDRPTRDLDFFGKPEQQAQVGQVAAAFERAAPRDFIDLVELTKRFPLEELIDLAVAKDPGLDLAILDLAMCRIDRIPAERLGLDGQGRDALLARVDSWRHVIRVRQGR